MPTPTDAELIAYAHRMMRQARPPLLDLLQRFLRLAATDAGNVRFDKKRYQRDYMRTYLPKWRAKRAQSFFDVTHD